jgi:RNA polymerase sigma-70 factor (ECF subfamily)
VAVPAELEPELRRRFDAGDLSGTATLAVERYGPEILGVLTAQLRSSSQAAEAFAMFTEDLWRGLPGFQWRCSLRAWAHRLARNAAIRHVRAPPLRRERNLRLSDADEVWQMAERVRTTTEVHLRSEIKSEIRRLREELPAEDQLLLVLHVDKGMEWREVAAAMADDDLDEFALERESARLRKRFQAAKDRLRDLARDRGLLPDG